MASRSTTPVPPPRSRRPALGPPLCFLAVVLQFVAPPLHHMEVAGGGGTGHDEDAHAGCCQHACAADPGGAATRGVAPDLGGCGHRHHDDGSCPVCQTYLQLRHSCGLAPGAAELPGPQPLHRPLPPERRRVRLPVWPYLLGFAARGPPVTA